MQQPRSKSSKNLEFSEESRVMYLKNKKDKYWKIYFPEQFGYAGWFKFFTYLSEFFSWRRMRSDITSYTRACDTCQRVKYLNYKIEGAYQFLQATEPNELVSVDFYGPLLRSIAGVQYLFFLQDLFSKLANWLLFTRSKNVIRELD